MVLVFVYYLLPDQQKISQAGQVHTGFTLNLETLRSVRARHV